MRCLDRTAFVYVYTTRKLEKKSVKNCSGGNHWPWTTYQTQLATEALRYRHFCRLQTHILPPQMKSIRLPSAIVRRRHAERCTKFTGLSAWRRQSCWRCWLYWDVLATTLFSAINMVNVMITGSVRRTDHNHSEIYKSLWHPKPNRLTLILTLPNPTSDAT